MYTLNMHFLIIARENVFNNSPDSRIVRFRAPLYSYTADCLGIQYRVEVAYESKTTVYVYALTPTFADMLRCDVY